MEWTPTQIYDALEYYDRENNPISARWTEEHDHFIIYLAHSPTVWPHYKNLPNIYEQVTGVFPDPGLGFFLAFLGRLNDLSCETNNGKDVLPLINLKRYFWAYNEEYNPFVRRNPRREVRNKKWVEHRGGEKQEEVRDKD